MSMTTNLAGIPVPEGVSIRTLATSDAARIFVMFDKGEMSAEDQQQLAAMLSQVPPIQSDVDAWAKIVLDSWNDSALRARVEADPGAVLAQYGYAFPDASAGVAHSSTSAVAAADDGGMTVGDVAASITTSMESITKLITAGSYVAGLAFSIGAMMKFKQHKDNPTQVPIGTPVALVFIAAALLFLPSILGVAGQTMFGSGGGTTAGPTGTVFTGG